MSNDLSMTGPNYITLINRFWKADIEAGFSHLEVHLYFKLLEINNRLGWKKTFKYPNTRLQSEVGARQKNLIAARQKLIEKGLIVYEKGTTREAGIYQLLSDGMTKESNQGTNCNNYFQNNFQKEEQKKVIRGTLNRIEKNKQDKRENGVKISYTLKSISERASNFKNEIWEIAKGTKYENETSLEKFFGYWSEHGPRDKKMRFEKETSFDIKRRLGTWWANEKRFNDKKNNTSLAPGQILKNENYKVKEEF